MNDQTGQLIEKLAQKLGTTAQYLWSVLLKQAPISSTVSIFQWALVALAGYILYRLNSKFNKENPTGNPYNTTETMYEKYETGLPIIMIIAGLIWIVLVVCCLFSIEDVINGYFNPEYWALHQILSSAKSN